MKNSDVTNGLEMIEFHTFLVEKDGKKSKRKIDVTVG